MTSQYLSWDANRRRFQAFNKWQCWWSSMRLSWIHCAGYWLPQRKRGGCTSHKTVNGNWILMWEKMSTLYDSNSQKTFTHAEDEMDVEAVYLCHWFDSQLTCPLCFYHASRRWLRTENKLFVHRQKHGTADMNCVGAWTVRLIAARVLEYFLVHMQAFPQQCCVGTVVGRSRVSGWDTRPCGPGLQSKVCVRRVELGVIGEKKCVFIIPPSFPA